MAEPFTRVWRHYTGVANSDGIVNVSSGNSSGSHALCGGGFATASSGSDTDVSPSGTHGAPVALVGTYSEYDSGTDTTFIGAIFQATPGASVRCHVWVILA